MKKVAILGSTGSIGTQALKVISENSDKLKVFAVSCEKNTDLLCEQIERFRPEIAVTASEGDALALSKRYRGTEFFYGVEGLVHAVQAGCDVVLNALVGISGLLPTYKAILAGKDVALANKETLVAGGKVIMDAVKKQKVRLIPVDSEHSALFQCLSGNSMSEVRRLILTTSGGPFRGYSPERLRDVTVEQALSHPKWSMGSKVTVDSATMMNKGLEIIEAKWLFDMREDKIDVVAHPQCIIHSMVEFVDGTVMAQMSKTDMKVPISFALGYPARIKSGAEPVDFPNDGPLTFEKPDEDTFVCMKLARRAIRDEDSSYPVVLNAANEILVQQFLEGKIKFTEIQDNIERELFEHKPEYGLDIGQVLELDAAVKNRIRKK